MRHPVSLFDLDPLDFAQIEQAGSANVQNRAFIADRNFPDRFRIPDLVSRCGRNRFWIGARNRQLGFKESYIYALRL